MSTPSGPRGRSSTRFEASGSRAHGRAGTRLGGWEDRAEWFALARKVRGGGALRVGFGADGWLESEVAFMRRPRVEWKLWVHGPPSAVRLGAAASMGPVDLRSQRQQPPPPH
ncbi:hypothetical protein PCL_09956 [Purpureocillium lilacinum]|uniref:Uncharacterized protein n=1 Tax=Purpureocillium lilacinum TaxID=33203 RepID=A0A2U3EEJ4_PURLI|nr:hypothetical protein Purlil1_1023 [Purpureocillium lilacinum]PWI72941.1 hypothetical protein PCL_09956 [Purpureocillium lilacinum]